MNEHRYQVGQTLDFKSASRARSAATGEYKIVACRPPSDGEPMYLIKSELERHERIASESELKWIR